MYISSFLTLNTALSGVEAAQEELDTTGQNITNANTPGYEEQTVNTVEAASLDISGAAADGAMQLGTGVNAIGISNSGDPYLDAAWRQTNAASSGATTTQTFMQQIQTALNEPSKTGIASQLSTFWNDWNDLADNPNSPAAQQAVVQQGQTVAEAFNSLSDELNGPNPGNPLSPTNTSSVMGQINAQYMATMEGPTASGASGGTVFNAAYNISALNYSIVQAKAAGQSPNDLIDQRNAALDSLSAIGNVTVENNADGSVNVYFGGVTGKGNELVSDPVGQAPGGAVPPGDNFGSYSPGAPATGTGWAAAFQAQFATAAGANTSAASLANTVGGQLGSMIGLAGYSASGFGNLGSPTFSGGTTSYTTPVAATQPGTIGTITAALDNVASNLAAEVNNPTVTGSSTALTLNAPFFTNASGTASTGITAANLQVSTSLQTAAQAGITPQAVSSATPAGGNTQGTTNVQVSSLAVSPPATIGANASDNDVALDEAANAGGTADTAYQAFVQQVGSLAQGANTQASTQSALATQITNQRTSVEGVDLSQEMANLITEQQSYQASAKVMNAFSTVMNSLMTTVGQ